MVILIPILHDAVIYIHECCAKLSSLEYYHVVEVHIRGNPPSLCLHLSI